MILILKVVYKYIIVSIMMSLVYGCAVLSSSLINNRSKKCIISPYLFQIWSLILFIVVWGNHRDDIQIFKPFNILNWKNIFLLFMAVIPVSIIAYCGNKSKPTYQFKLRHFLDGASMEIPMRLLSQNLFVILGINMTVYKSISLVILLNAIIFVQFIMIQEAINGKKITSAILPEITASFWFSIFVGILYENTGNIAMPMIAHGLQRMFTYNIRKKFAE